MRTALKLNPDSGLAHSHLGIWLAGRGLLAKAEEHFIEAARLHPQESDSHNNLVLCQYSELGLLMWFVAIFSVYRE